MKFLLAIALFVLVLGCSAETAKHVSTPQPHPTPTTLANPTPDIALLTELAMEHNNPVLDWDCSDAKQINDEQYDQILYCDALNRDNTIQIGMLEYISEYAPNKSIFRVMTTDFELAIIGECVTIGEDKQCTEGEISSVGKAVSWILELWALYNREQ